MITFNIEPFSQVYGELCAILEAHYREISHHHEHGFLLNPQVESYRAREADGSLMMVIGRKDGEIVAYYVCFIAPGLHYKDCLTCSPDIFYVKESERHSSAGIRMFRFIQKELKRRGVKLWFMGSKNAHDSTAIFRRLGAKPVETTYSLWLED